VLAALYSAAFWVFLAITSMACFPVAVVLRVLTAPFDRRRVVLHQFTCFWAALYTWCSPAWSLRVVGRERMEPGVTYVIVANHASLVDIFVMFRLFRHFKWVSKIENFRLPLIGWNMSLNGYIPLKRGDKTSVIKMLQACRETLAAGNSIVMFPEGTRSRDGRMKPFKPGAFELAIETGTPLLPMAIHGSRDALPRKGWVIHGHHDLTLEVLEPLTPEAFGDRSPEALAAHVRERILAALDGPGTVRGS
jgi:1-acyl-sn-glycerol-3-phosphate acyltransferase